MVTKRAKPESARVRLLAAADQLFYSEGILSVGIDRILERAGVAKGSLYYNFSGKDALVRSYLLGRLEGWSGRLSTAMSGHEKPIERMLSVFDTLHSFFSEPGYNGCPFINASAEAIAGSAEYEVVADYRVWLHTVFVQASIDVGACDPYLLAAQLVLQYDGAMIASKIDHNPEAALVARNAASLLIEASLPHDCAADPVIISLYQ